MYDLDAVLSRLHDELKGVEAVRKNILDDIGAVRRTMSLADGDDEDEGQPQHGPSTPENITNCKTHMDAAVALARQNGNVLMVTPAAKVIKAAGLSRAKITSIASTLHNRASSSDDWQYTEPGEFLYVGPEPTRHTQWSLPASDPLDDDDSPF